MHLDTTAGPRDVLGSQRPKSGEDGQIYFRPPMHSDALRAEDVSRSGYSGHRSILVVVSRCTRASGRWGMAEGSEDENENEEEDE